MILFLIAFIYLMYVCVSVWYTHATARVWRSEDKSEGFGPPLPAYGIQESNSGYQAWLQALLPTEPPPWTLNYFKVLNQKPEVWY